MNRLLEDQRELSEMLISKPRWKTRVNVTSSFRVKYYSFSMVAGRANTQKNVHGKMFVWSVVALLVLLPLATASFLSVFSLHADYTVLHTLLFHRCCHGEGKGSGSMKTRTLSKKDR